MRSGGIRNMHCPYGRGAGARGSGVNDRRPVPLLIPALLAGALALAASGCGRGNDRAEPPPVLQAHPEGSPLDTLAGWVAADGVVDLDWLSLMSDVRVLYEEDGYRAQFEEKIRKLNGRQVRIQGFIVPVNPSDLSSNVVLSALPMNACFFCGVGGPETIMEVESREKLKVEWDMVELAGRLEIIEHEKTLAFYRLKNAHRTKWKAGS